MGPNRSSNEIIGDSRQEKGVRIRDRKLQDCNDVFRMIYFS
jgi:hypothetical protein